MPGRARGRMESWQKWSFPISPLSPGQRQPGRLAAGTQEAAGQPVLAGRRADRGTRPGQGHEPGCEVELTEVHPGGQDWWTLGFEATGPADLLRSELQATVALVFAQARPVASNPAWVTPGPMRSGCVSRRTPRATPTPECCHLSAEPTGPPFSRHAGARPTGNARVDTSATVHVEAVRLGSAKNW